MNKDFILKGRGCLIFEYAEPKQELASRSDSQSEAGKKYAKSNLTGIPDMMKMRLENLSGFSFDDVRVHYNSDKPAQLQAAAYTHGSNVYIAPGQNRHLGHELGHVIQQKQGRVKPESQLNGMYINSDPALERDADRISLH